MAEFLQSIQAGDESADPAEPEVRLAVYDSPLAAPRVVSLRGREFHAFVGELAARTYNFGRERGGRIPYIVIREILENLIHAYFQGAVISILDDGNTIRISDQGPGIPDKEKADRKSTRLNSSHVSISYAVFCSNKNTRSLGLDFCLSGFGQRQTTRRDQRRDGRRASRTAWRNRKRRR